MAKQPTTAARNWPDNLSFGAFKLAYPLSNSSIYDYLYQTYGEQIQVKKEKVVLTNLEKILGATFKLSNEVGFHSMSLRDLCRETGISMGGIYAYIRSKENLALMIEMVVCDLLHNLLSEILKDIQDIEHKLEAAVRAHIYMGDLFQPWFYFVFMEAKTFSKQQKELAKEAELKYEKRLSKLIRQGQKRAIFSNMDAQAVAALIISAQQDWHLKRWKYGNKRMSAQAYADMVVIMIKRLLSSR